MYLCLYYIEQNAAIIVVSVVQPKQGHTDGDDEFDDDDDNEGHDECDQKEHQNAGENDKSAIDFFYQTRLQCFCPPIMMLLLHEYDDDVRGPAEMMMLPADIMTMMTRSQLKMMQ